MTAPASQTQWYLAREGQQYGPLSDAELGKFVELGHLQPNDLLWREGFPDWRPALVVFPQRPAKPTPAVKRPPPDFGAPASPRLGAERPAADIASISLRRCVYQSGNSRLTRRHTAAACMAVSMVLASPLRPASGGVSRLLRSTALACPNIGRELANSRS